MRLNKKIIAALIASVTLGATSCKKFLDVNTNPNVAHQATLQTLLPAAELYVGTAQGVDLEINGSFWAQYWTESPVASQYRILDTYNPGQDQFSTPWTNLYAANEGFYQLYKLADSQNANAYKGIALLMQTYTYQLLTDGWGDVPFTYALKGQYADGHIVNPKYDSQMVIYNALIANIDTANALLANPGATLPGTDDLVYSGAIGKWQAFSNTLQLRIWLRMSQINAAAAQAGIAALYATAPAFIGVGGDAFIPYGFNTANKNPLYAEASSTTLGSTQNLVASSTIIDSMNSNSDPRLNIFFEVAPASGTFVGVRQGLTSTISASTFSIPNIYVAGDARNSNSGNAPVNFLTSYESLFMQAEVAARGWASTGEADSTLFYAAIKANFEYYNAAFTATTGVSADSNYTIYRSANGYWTQYPSSGTTASKIEYIITQKWFAMCGNEGFEAWTEWRRTGYPSCITSHPSINPSASSYPQPRRFLYPTSESTTNSSFPGLKTLGTPVWWDVI